jgi:hypothetical protein
MKARIYFDLEDPADEMAHLRCLKSLQMALALFDIKVLMHRALDTSENGKTIDGIDFEKHLNAIFESYGINLDELVV